MKAKDIMTTSLITIPMDGTVAEATDLMLTHRISALPVTDTNKTVVGILSEGDLMRRIRDQDEPRNSWWLNLIGQGTPSVQDFVKARSQRVSDVMTPEVFSVDEETPVGEIARLLEKHRVKRVPVLQNGRAVGIVSRANLLHALSAMNDEALPQPLDDDRNLRALVEEALREVPGAAIYLLNYTVQSGNVVIWGTVDSGLEEKAIRVAVENVPGVKSVELNLGRMPAWGYGI